MIRYFQRVGNNINHGKLWELGLSIVVSVLLAALVITYPYLPLPSDFQKLLLFVPFAITLVILFNNLQRLILFAVAIAIPLNLDISLIISPYARNAQNIASGRTIVALTELRLSLVLIIVILGYIFWLVEHRSIVRPPVRFYTSTTISAIGLILVSIFSLIQAQDKQLSFIKIAQLIELFLIYFYLANHIRSRNDLTFLITILMAGMLAESLLMIIQWRTGLRFSIAGINASVYKNPIRPGGTLGPPDVAAGILAAQLVINSAMIWFYPMHRQKVFAIICFFVGGTALISTAGRAAWGSIIFSIMFLLFMGWRYRWIKWTSLIGVLILVFSIGIIFYQPIYIRLTADDHGSAASRIMMFRLAWNVISSSPSHFFFGVGANNYALIASSYLSTDVGNLGYIIDSSVHNAYLLAWSELGLMGLTFFLSFLLIPVVKSLIRSKSINQSFSIMALALGCALITLEVQMFVDPFILRPWNIYLWVIIALIASLENIKSFQMRNPTLRWQ